MMPLSRLLKYGTQQTLCFFSHRWFWVKKPLKVLSVVIISIQNCAAETVLHRAVEPAQMLLDITLKQNTLTIFVTLPHPAIKLVSDRKSAELLVADLQAAPSLWHPSLKAGCTLNRLRIGVATEQDGVLQVHTGISGFYEFHCAHPERLFTIYPELKKPLPGLKQLNVWVVTEGWQSKQMLSAIRAVIRMQSGGE